MISYQVIISSHLISSHLRKCTYIPAPRDAADALADRLERGAEGLCARGVDLHVAFVRAHLLGVVWNRGYRVLDVTKLR
jgi:hypothetical protein